MLPCLGTLTLVQDPVPLLGLISSPSLEPPTAQTLGLYILPKFRTPICLIWVEQPFQAQGTPIPITPAWPSHHSLRSPGPHDLGVSLVGVGWQVLPGEAVVVPEGTERDQGGQAASCPCDPSGPLESLEKP